MIPTGRDFGLAEWINLVPEPGWAIFEHVEEERHVFIGKKLNMTQQKRGTSDTSALIGEHDA